MPVGNRRIVSGTTALYDGMLQMIHPDRVVDESDFAKLPLIEPQYALTEGLSMNQVRRAIEGALAKVPALPEWQDAAWLARSNFPTFADALHDVHRPPQPEISPADTAWSRLAYDEFLAGQLALGLVRAHARRPRGRQSAGDGTLRKRIIAALPYDLTGAQLRADGLRLPISANLNGCRGSSRATWAPANGVALLAGAECDRSRAPVALMAPTELLARQHWNTIAPLAQAAGICAAILSVANAGAPAPTSLRRLARGEIDLLIGTHALFQDDVDFRDLALAVVDEQHRFGVHQRLALARKGEAVDLLVMTATPIPRTLVLTFFGDMDSSELRAKPAGRQPIDTRTIPLERLNEIVDAVGRALREERRVYWVCPLVEESELIDLAAAQDRFRTLAARFGGVVDLVHGKMKGPDKDAAMARFAAGESKLLVATTVIEVGVDVPGGIRDGGRARRAFGLDSIASVARPHRARQRALDVCYFLQDAARRNRQARLAVIRETEDGFSDCRRGSAPARRGGGSGTRQSRLPPLPRGADRNPRATVAGRAR